MKFHREVYLLFDYNTGVTTVHESMLSAEEYFADSNALVDMHWTETSPGVWYSYTPITNMPEACIERVTVLK